MALVNRVKNILLAPKTEWPAIAAEPATVQSIYSGYVLILAALGPLALLVRAGVFGVLVPIASYAIGLVVTYVLALVVDALAPTFGGEKDFIASLKVTAYSYTAAWVGAIFQIVPVVGGIIGLAAIAYAFYTFYLGVPVLKKCPPEKAVAYTIVVVLCGLLIGFLLGGVLMSALMGGGMMGLGAMH